MRDQKYLGTCLLLAALFASGSANLSAQQISGAIQGSVRDSQQAAIANAKLSLNNPELGITREAQTNTDGSFVFAQVQPGTYTLTIESPGFKRFVQREIKLFANDRVALGDITLEVGAISESVTVEAQAAVIQTASAERSGVLTNRQVLETGLLSRSLFDLARTIPGIITGNSTSGLGVGSINANGNRSNQNNFTLDGVTNMDTGSNGGSLTTTNVDMIAEMKVITNSQPAEFGRASGAQIQVVTKSGTRDFHGTGYWFHRHEGLNANTWRNNIDGRQRQFYRYNYAGFNVGGPVLLPGSWNKERDKLFFFAGIEWQNQLVPNDLRNVSVPSALERTGNFSQSHDAGGVIQTIFDPANNKQPFPGNIIPANRLSADGMKILNWYPKPNAEGRDPAFNYQTQISNQYPRREEVYRGDYSINDKWRAYGRFIRSADETKMAYGQWNASYNIPLAPMSFGAPGWSYVGNVTTIINPTLTNEFVFGSSRNDLHIYPVDHTWDRSNVNLSYKMPFPDADTLQLVQNWNYGGVPNAPTSGFNGTPFKNFNHTIDITDSLAKIHGSHTFKGGIYIHKSAKDQTAFTSVNGTIWFDRDANNPLDTNWAFANAALGNYQRLQQSSVVLNGQYRSWNVEWYVQDNWRISKKLTLDYGIRFYWIQPQYDQAYQTSAWNMGLWNSANAGVLRYGALDSNGNRISVDPISGQTGPASLIGSLVNTGKGFVNGLYANGMGLSNKNGYPAALIDGQGINFAPRLGLAYTITPKTVVRAGAGIFYDRLQGNPVFDMLPNPPSTAIPQFYYGTLATIPSAASGAFFPQNVNGFDKAGQIPTTYNWNLTVQRELPFAILFDVGYVGSNSNHLLYRYNQNAIPLGAAWLPQNQDPLVSAPKFDGTTSKQANFYRPFVGFAGTTAYGFGANSNYHSLQMSANRRLGKNFTFGIAYTWSKAMGTTNDDYAGNLPFNLRTADYDVLSTDRTHVFVANYVYNTPKFIKADSVGGKILGGFVNDWQISGITSIQSGQPGSVGFSVSGWGNLNERFTGSPDIGPRVVYKSRMNYPQTQYQWLDASVLALPAVKGSQGFDSSRLPIRYPGLHNYDISIIKNIPLYAERVRMQLRCEMFNAFNHPQFTSINNSAQFNQAGKLINTPAALGGTGGRFGFGAVTDTAAPRRIQLAAKIYF
ncbi:MAG: carboxypeptidase regulatory-like domain-containing protein [Bryobacterales bacterium]|nr:carboxypeptidase regulatory-like domain-containing protein [Bryobacterales bacterium]